MLFKNPLYEKYFKTFIYSYESKPNGVVGSGGPGLAGGPIIGGRKIPGDSDDFNRAFPYRPQSMGQKAPLLPAKRFALDSDSDSDSADELDISRLQNDKDDERYNQEAYRKRRAAELTAQA
jgi:hypothetical protein